MDLTEKVIAYHKAVKENGASSAEAAQLKEQICREVLHLSYYIPQKQFRLHEEDASEFSLEVYREIDYLLKNYKPELASFYRFLNSYLEFRVRKFYTNRNRANHKEKAILEGHEYYEEKMQREENLNRLFEPVAPRHLPQQIKKKMLFTFMRNTTIHKRFFVLALTSMPFMGASSITELCSLFRFERRQTISLCERLNSLCTQQVSETARLEERRNYYWGRMLQLNEQMAAENVVAFSTENENLSFLAELNRQKHRNRIKDLDERVPRVPYSTLASELGLPVKTLSSMLFGARNYVSWLLSEDSQCLPNGRTGVSRLTVREIEKGLWKDMNIRPEAVPILKPSDHFTLKMLSK